MRNNLMLWILFLGIVLSKEVFVSRIHSGLDVMFLHLHRSNQIMIEFFIKSTGLNFKDNELDQRQLHINNQGNLISFDKQNVKGSNVGKVRLKEKCKFNENPDFWFCNLKFHIVDGYETIPKLAGNEDHFLKLQLEFMYQNKNYTANVDRLKYFYQSENLY